MSEYAIKPLDASTWDAFARLAEKHSGVGFGGCWCTWFHSREGRPEGEMGRPWKERLVREGNAHAASSWTGTIDGKASRVWRFVVPSTSSRRRAAAWWRAIRRTRRARRFRPSFYNTTRSLYEQTGFSYDRPKGKNHCVMRMTVEPVAASRRARVG